MSGEDPSEKITPSQEWDALFAQLDFTNVDDEFVQIVKQLTDIAKKSSQIINDKRAQYAEIDVAFRNAKIKKLEQEVDFVLDRCSNELFRLFAPEHLLEARATDKAKGEILSRYKKLRNWLLQTLESANVFSSTDPNITAAQRQKYTALTEKIKQLNGYIEKVAALPTQEKKHKAEINQIFEDIAKAPSGSSLSFAIQKLASFFQAQDKQQTFSAEHATFLNLKRLFDAVRLDPDSYLSEEGARRKAADEYSDERLTRFVFAAIKVDAVAEKRVFDVFITNLQRRLPLVSPKNFRTIKSTILDERVSFGKAKAIQSRTVKEVETIEQTLQSSSLDALQEEGLAQELELSITEVSLRPPIRDTIQTAIQDQVFDRVGDLIVELIGQNGDSQQVMAVIDKYAAKNNKLGSFKQFLQRSLEAFEKDAKPQALQSSFLTKRIEELPTTKVMLARLDNQNLKSALLQVLQRWAAEQPKIWRAELETQKNVLKSELSPVLENAVPIWVEKAVANIPKGVLSDEQLQSIARRVIAKSLETLRSDLQQLSVESIRNTSIADDLEFVRTSQSLRPQVGGKAEWLFAGILNQDQNRDETTFGNRLRPNERVSGILWKFVNQVGRGIFEDVNPISSAAEFAVSSPQSVRPQDVVLADGKTENFLLARGENLLELQERKKKKIRDGMLSVFFARHVSSRAEVNQNQLVQKRKAYQAAIGLSHPSYVKVSKQDEILYEPARQEARDVLLSMGFEPTDVEANLQQIELPKNAGGLIEFSIGILFDERGTVDLLGSSVQVPPRPGLEQGGSISSRGRLKRIEVLGEDFEWYSNRLSSQERTARLENFLMSGIIDFDMMGYLDGDTKSPALTRANSADLFTPSSMRFSIGIKVHEMLDEAAIKEIRSFAETTSYSLDMLKNAIRSKVSESAKLHEFFTKVNLYVADKVREVMNNIPTFLKNANVAVAPESLKALDWCNLLMNLVIGKFSQSEPLTPSFIWDQDSELKKREDFEEVLKLGARS